MGENKKERKDHVLQARVSKEMYKDLVSQAKRLRVPVSNLVRNILEDSLRMVENIVDGGIEIAETLSGKVGKEDLESVVGWQSIIANKSLPCSCCNERIHQGEEVFMAVGAPRGRTIIICGECKCKTLTFEQMKTVQSGQRKLR